MVIRSFDQRVMVMKHGKVLFCIVWLAILGGNSAKRPDKKQKVVMDAHARLYNQSIGKLRICSSCKVYEHKTKDLQDQGPSNINPWRTLIFIPHSKHALA